MLRYTTRPRHANNRQLRYHDPCPTNTTTNNSKQQRHRQCHWNDRRHNNLQQCHKTMQKQRRILRTQPTRHNNRRRHQCQRQIRLLLRHRQPYPPRRGNRNKPRLRNRRYNRQRQLRILRTTRTRHDRQRKHTSPHRQNNTFRGHRPTRKRKYLLNRTNSHTRPTPNHYRQSK